MLIKGQDVSNIKFGNTLSADGLPGKRFDYMLSNPPFGVEWKKSAVICRSALFFRLRTESSLLGAKSSPVPERVHSPSIPVAAAVPTMMASMIDPNEAVRAGHPRKSSWPRRRFIFR